MSHTYIPLAVRREREKTKRARLRDEIIERITQNALGENADPELVRPMITRRFYPHEEHAFTAIVKRRAQLAQDNSVPFSIFRNVSIDTPLAGEIALVKSYQSKVEDGHNQTKRKTRTNRERAKGLTDKVIAQLFNQKAVPLIVEYREEEVVETRTQRVKKQRCTVYEKRRGGNKNGIYAVGECSERTVRDWIKKYPDEHSAEPHSGFHAGMLLDRRAIEQAAERWGEYWRGYAKAFFDWRQGNRFAPRSQFRYTPEKTVHGAEKIASVDSLDY